MVKPSLKQLTDKEHLNRYALAMATAKVAKAITDEHVKEKDFEEKLELDDEKVNYQVINEKYRDEKAVQNAVEELYDGEYRIVESSLPEGMGKREKEE